MEEALRRDPDLWFGMPEPKFEISDENGHTLPWWPRRGGSSDGEADGDVLVADLPDAGDLEVEVPRVVYDAYEDGEYRGDGPSYGGSWVFRFTLLAGFLPVPRATLETSGSGSTKSRARMMMRARLALGRFEAS